ncbi:MAG: histidinol-phosphate transaminase [Elusimicrobia bacterium]|nr:histidinol-phosphate transaminase [Elusimicrobiota bacterium]
MGLNTSPRRCLASVIPYAPGKSIASVQRELGLKNVVKLASNENPLGPSPKAMAVYRRVEKQCHIYPEGASPELRQAIARFHKLAPEQVLVGNGSDELIRYLCEAFVDPEDEVVVSQYGFIRFRQQALLMGARVIEVPMVDWTHDLETMAKAASARTKLLFVANPNNPTGTYNTEDEVRRLLKTVPRSTLVVLDEAYCQFAGEWDDYPTSIPDLVREHDNVVVLRTFSKAYGLAGLRVGYAVADPEVLSWLDRIRMPFNVNLPAQQACIEALKDAAFVRRSVSVVSTARAPLAASLRELGFSVQDSATNFLFVKCPIPGRELFKGLLKLGVIIRPLDEYGLKEHARISIGSRDQNRQLLAALRQLIGVPV